MALHEITVSSFGSQFLDLSFRVSGVVRAPGRVQGAGCRVQGAGCRVQGSEYLFQVARVALREAQRAEARLEQPAP